MADRELQIKAVHLRKKTLEMIFDAGTSHAGRVLAGAFGNYFGGKFIGIKT